MHIIVRIIVRNGGRILSLQRGDSAPDPRHWEIPGGMLEDGETLEQAMRRELKEETGLKIDRFNYEGSSVYKARGEQRLGVLFSAKVDSEGIKLSREHKSYKWVDGSNYQQIGFVGYYKTLMDELFSGQNTNTPSTNKAQYNELKVYTDGGSRGNPGQSASAYVLLDGNDEVIEEGGEYLGITTNNQAEYQAVRFALEAAGRFTKGKLHFYMDSLLVANQLNGVYKIKNRDLWPIYTDIKELVKNFNDVDFHHIPREQNNLADAKVNQILDAHAD